MVEYKDVMLTVAAVSATIAGFGLVFLGLTTTSYIGAELNLLDTSAWRYRPWRRCSSVWPLLRVQSTG